MRRSPRSPRWTVPPGSALALWILALVAPGPAAAASCPVGHRTAGLPPRPRPAGAHPDPPAPDTAPGAWDAPRVRRLVASAVEARRDAWSDSTLRAFRAEAQGHVYFLGGLGGGPDDAGLPSPGDLQLVRADQVALRVRWARGSALQTIVGRRSEKRLPTGIRYHIDHLSLILRNFGDRISLGEGTEVRDVPHPVSPGGTSLYEYRLADSLGIGIGGETRTLYRVEVRPREPSEAAVVGEIHLDAGSRAVARMRFTFTPAAYRDEDVESIEVELESALWDGRWWLPAEQEVTVRRQVRWLDFPLEGVIRTRIRVLDYEVNPEPPPHLPTGRRVVTLPEQRLQAFSGWRGGLYDGPLGDVDGGGARDSRDLRRRARELVAGRYLGGQARLAPSLSGVSEVIRARRAEGGLGGMGGRYRLDDARTLRVWAGHPFEAGGAEWLASYTSDAGPLRLEVQAYADRLTDVGPVAAASGLVSTFGFMLRGEDFTDPYFRDGVSVSLDRPWGDGRLGARLLWEHHAPARLVAEPPGDDARPVRPAARGELGSLSLRWGEPLGRILGGRLSMDLEAEGATPAVGDYGFTRLLLRLRARSRPGSGPWSWRLRGGAGVAGGKVPPQRLYLLGGRGTVPGYPFRAWGGDRAGWLRVEVGRDVPGLAPWIRVRGIAGGGWADLGGAGRAAATAWRTAATAASAGTGSPGALAGTRRLTVAESGGVRTSLGAGLGFLDGALRVDAVRGLDGGRWEWMVSVAPRFRGVL